MKRSEIKQVGAITIIQPWAEIILHHGKNVENRQKNSHYRGTVAIHSSSKRSREYFDDCSVEVDPDEVSYGAILGFAQLVDVITEDTVTAKTEEWFTGGYGLVLSNVIALKKPVFTKGARGLWTLGGKVLKACLEQVNDSQLKKFQEFKRQND